MDAVAVAERLGLLPVTLLNDALRSVATGGLFLGGGIAPKILPALQDGRFIEAFFAKAPMAAFMSRVRVGGVFARLRLCAGRVGLASVHFAYLVESIGQQGEVP